MDATFLSEGRFFQGLVFRRRNLGRPLSFIGRNRPRSSQYDRGDRCGCALLPSDYRLPLAESELRASIRAGLGALVSPVYAIDAFHSVTSKIEYDVEMVDRAYAFAGATLSYGIPVSSLTLSLFLSADVGMADFYAASGGDSIILSRVGLGFRLSHENSKKRARKMNKTVLAAGGRSFPLFRILRFFGRDSPER